MSAVVSRRKTEAVNCTADPPLHAGLVGRVCRGSVALLCEQATAVVSSILLVPLFLAAWTPAVYGEWLALSSVAAYLATLDLGVSTASINRLTHAYARGDLAGYRYYRDASFVFYVAMALGGSAVVAVLVWALPVPRWLGLSLAPVEARWVLLLLGAQTLWLMPVAFLGNAYRTFGNLARSQWVGNGRQLAALLLVALVLWRGGSMTKVAAVQCIPPVLVAVFVVWDLGRRRADLLPRMRLARPAAMRDVAAPSLYFMAMLIAGALVAQGSVILVSGRLGGLAVGLFVVSRTLVNLTRQGTAMLKTVLWPDLTRLDARGERERLRVIHRILVTTTAAVSVAVGAALWFEGPEILGVWTRGAITPDPVLLRLLVISAILQAFWQASSVFSAAFNQHRTLAAAHMVSSVLGLVTAAALMGRWGAWAVPFGLMVGEAAACYVVVPRDTCVRLGEPYGPFALRQWLALVACAAVTFPMAHGLHGLLEGPAGLRWLAMGVATTATSALAAWLLGFRPEDRARLTNAFAPLLGGREARAAALRT